MGSVGDEERVLGGVLGVVLEVSRRCDLRLRRRGPVLSVGGQGGGGLEAAASSAQVPVWEEAEMINPFGRMRVMPSP